MTYQLYRRTWRGRVIFGVQIGKPYVSKKTGEPMLLRNYDEKYLDDVVSAARAAKKQIATMKQGVANQHAAAGHGTRAAGTAKLAFTSYVTARNPLRRA